MASLLEGRGLSVAAGGDSAPPLAGPVELSLAAGDVLGVSGPSGSGKTTLLRCLALLEAEADGEVRFEGRDVVDASVPGFRRSVVYLAQAPPRFAMTVGEAFERVFQLSSAAGASLDSERAAAIAERLGLPSDVADRPLAELSGGELQRVSLVRALLLDPVVLLLDEPTGALDPESRDAVVNELRQWLAGGDRAAVIVSHDPELTDGLATRRAVLRDGALTETT